jgi:hypothetical protein
MTYTSPRQMLQRREPPQRTGSPTPLLNKERGDKAQLCRGEVMIRNLVLTQVNLRLQ